MKIAVLSDNHGNIQALETVSDHIEAWQPDHVIFNGDVVNRGPKSLASWLMVQAKQQNDGWLMTRGNHEDYVLKHEKEEPNDSDYNILEVINQNSRWTYQQVKDHCPTIAALPDRVTLTAPDGSKLCTTHASIRGNRDCIFPEQTDEYTRQQIDATASVFVTSHIHHAYIKQIDETILVNTGSAGQHCYGETRASYAQIIWENGRWHATIIRLNYDMAATERDFYQSGFMDETGPVAHLIFHEWKTGQTILLDWRAQYLQAILNQEIDLETSVINTLAQYGLNGLVPRSQLHVGKNSGED